VLRLAPVYTWPPVDLRSEAGDVVDASLQPDRSAWSRRHAALRRIDEMSLSTTQLECAPCPTAAVSQGALYGGQQRGRNSTPLPTFCLQCTRCSSWLALQGCEAESAGK
jgi:hypothetical protein